MDELLRLVGATTLLFTGCLLISYGVASARRAYRPKVALPENAPARLVGVNGVYRCHYQRTTPTGLVFSAPLQQDRYVPIRPGEKLLVQVPSPDGALTFRTQVALRDAETHELVLEHPAYVRRVDRRSESRDSRCRGTMALVNGDEAVLWDLSAGGAKVLTPTAITPGESVSVKLPEGLGEAHGWALDSRTEAVDGALLKAVRIQFEQPLAGITVD